MVFCWDQYWGIVRWVVLYSDYVGTKLVWVYKDVLHLLLHTYCLIKDKVFCIYSLRVFICCGWLHNWHIFDNIICIRVWGHITIYTCVVNNDAIVSTYNIIFIRFQLKMAIYNGTSDLSWDLPPSCMESIDVATLIISHVI